eukprot:846743-Rhodomonas_salina.4
MRTSVPISTMLLRRSTDYCYAPTPYVSTDQGYAPMPYVSSSDAICQYRSPLLRIVRCYARR